MTETKFRADQVGSLLRPEALLNARRRHTAGKIGAEELRAAENAAIGHAVTLQVEAGIDVLTDGEFRRRDFRTGFVEAVDGFTMQTWEMPWHSGEGVIKVPSHTWVASARLAPRGRLAGDEAAYLLGLTSAPVKATLIAPGFLEDRFWKDGVTDQFYASREEFAAEVAAITRAEISALIADGVRYIQIDNPGYGAFLGSHPHGERAAFERMLATDIAAVDGVVRAGRRHHRLPRLPGQPVVDVDGRGRLRADRGGGVRRAAGGPVPARVRRRAGRRVRAAALRPAGQGGRPRAGQLEVRRAGAGRRAAAADRRGREVHRPRQPGAQPAVRVRVDRRGGNLLTEVEQYAKLALVAQVARATWGE